MITQFGHPIVCLWSSDYFPLVIRLSSSGHSIVYLWSSDYLPLVIRLSSSGHLIIFIWSSDYLPLVITRATTVLVNNLFSELSPFICAHCSAAFSFLSQPKISLFQILLIYQSLCFILLVLL